MLPEEKQGMGIVSHHKDIKTRSCSSYIAIYKDQDLFASKALVYIFLHIVYIISAMEQYPTPDIFSSVL